MKILPIYALTSKVTFQSNINSDNLYQEDLLA